jgi:hypothetical protein
MNLHEQPIFMYTRLVGVLVGRYQNLFNRTSIQNYTKVVIINFKKHGLSIQTSTKNLP